MRAEPSWPSRIPTSEVALPVVHGVNNRARREAGAGGQDEHRGRRHHAAHHQQAEEEAEPELTNMKTPAMVRRIAVEPTDGPVYEAVSVRDRALRDNAQENK